ncbi:MAG: glycosyltransferase family 2 protein [Clostridiales Family XIII bacterium]|jgi:glycosyltransferase involved in cell wall biosynthesis|nr:glycosyltransferase family 2 protein [Clostridiales Family XIII bacterium]
MERINPFFSIIVPSYNVEGYISTCLDSIVGQSFTDYEVILCDGSTDETARICKEYAAAQPVFSAIFGQDKGLAAARNTGLAAATGKYVLFLDADDFLEPNCLAALVWQMSRRPDCDLYMNDYFDYYSAENRVLVEAREPEGDARGVNGMLASLFRKNGNYIVFSWRHAFRRALLVERGICFDGVLRGCEDYDFFMRVMMSAQRVCASGIATHNYRRAREGSLTSSASPHLLMDNLGVFARWYEHIAKSPPDAGRDFLLNDIAGKFLFYTIQAGGLPKRKSRSLLRFAGENRHIIRAARGRFVSPARVALSVFGMRFGTKLMNLLFRGMRKGIRRSLVSGRSEPG